MWTKNIKTLPYFLSLLSTKRKWKPPKKKDSKQPSISSPEEVDKPNIRSRNENYKRQKIDLNYANTDDHGELLDNDEELALQLLTR